MPNLAWVGEERPSVLVGLAMKRVSGATVFLNARESAERPPKRLSAAGSFGARSERRWSVDAWAPLERSMINLGVRLVLH